MSSGDPRRPGFGGLGFDPAPGSLGSVEALAESFTAVARALAEARRELASVGTAAGSWTGDAADAFRSTVSELPAQLDSAEQSLSAVVPTLGGWHADLASMQGFADRLELHAVEARTALASAQAHPDLALAGRTFTDPGELRAAEERLANAQAAVARSTADLDAILEQAGRLLAQHTDLAALVAQSLNRAMGLAPEAPGLLEEWAGWIGRNLGRSSGDRMVELAVEGAQLVQDNANTIAAVSDVTADLSMFAGLTGLGFDLTGYGAVVGVPLAVVSGGLSVLALGGHLLARAGGADVPDETLWWDLAGVATAGAGGLAKVAEDVAPFLEAGSRVITGGAPLVQADQELGGDPEMATVFDDIAKYWFPRDVEQALLPLAPIVVPYLNAVNEGHAADEQARREHPR